MSVEMRYHHDIQTVTSKTEVHVDNHGVHWYKKTDPLQEQQLRFLVGAGVPVPRMVTAEGSFYTQHAGIALSECGMDSHIARCTGELLANTHELLKQYDDGGPPLFLDPVELAHPIRAFHHRYHLKQHPRIAQYLAYPGNVPEAVAAIGTSLMALNHQLGQRNEPIITESLILGDYKPENLLWDNDIRRLTIIDPDITRGETEYDPAKFCGRALLEPKFDQASIREFFEAYSSQYPLRWDRFYTALQYEVAGALTNYMSLIAEGDHNYRLIRGLLESADYNQQVRHVVTMLKEDDGRSMKSILNFS